MAYARKRDSSEKAIFDALVKAGCDVERGTDCDLYVRVPAGYRYLSIWTEAHAFMLECKTPGPNAKRRQPIQLRLQAIFGDRYRVVSTASEALIAVGLVP